MVKRPTRRVRRRGVRRTVAVPLLLLLLWLGGLVWYAEDIPRAVDDAASETDAVIVLTGGSGRLEEGFRLLAEGRAKKLFISGVPREVTAEELMRRYGRDVPAELLCCVAIGHTAGDTVGNALESSRWMAEEGFFSLRLVTASYHMRRSLLEFRRAMPSATVIPHPVFPEGFRIVEWWRWPGTLNLLISEYSKFLVVSASQALGMRLPVKEQAPSGAKPVPREPAPPASAAPAEAPPAEPTPPAHSQPVQEPPTSPSL